MITVIKGSMGKGMTISYFLNELVERVPYLRRELNKAIEAKRKSFWEEMDEIDNLMKTSINKWNIRLSWKQNMLKPPRLYFVAQPLIWRFEKRFVGNKYGIGNK